MLEVEGGYLPSCCVLGDGRDSAKKEERKESAGPLRPTEPTTRMIRTLTLTKRRMGWAGWRKGDVDDGLGVYRQWDGLGLVVLVGAQVGGA